MSLLDRILIGIALVTISTSLHLQHKRIKALETKHDMTVRMHVCKCNGYDYAKVVK